MSLGQALLGSVAYHKQRSHKIEAPADGIFAIVMTLLVLDIRIPLKEMVTENGVWLSLVHVLPKILTFFLPFRLLVNSRQFLVTSLITSTILTAMKMLTPCFI